METNIRDIPHIDFIAQLVRHLVSVPPSQVQSAKRGSVALIIRLVLPKDKPFPTIDLTGFAQLKTTASLVQVVSAFLSNPLLSPAKAQILFIQRAKYPGDPWSGHIGFPGGKRDPTDASDQVTAERETQEELGVDLTNPSNFLYLGRLDDTCLYSLFTPMRMVASPHVYLQVCGDTPNMVISDEVASAHWVDFDHILQAMAQPVQPFSKTYRSIPVSIASRLFPAYRPSRPMWYRLFERIVGSLHYTVLLLKHNPQNSIVRTTNHVATAESWCGSMSFASDTELYLWGLSLSMLSSLVDLSLPVKPHLVSHAYVSIASPWPQMEPYLWADVNYVLNKAHGILWSPYRRKPWYVKVQQGPQGRIVGNNDDFFKTYFNVLRVAFPLSCVCKAAILGYLSKLAISGTIKLVKLLLAQISDQSCISRLCLI
ncbi:hypothetical protein H4S04_003702 [Coemansia sp. S16]|nr:hypothetical protein GGI14_002431 [Coemansia sp. S680]KAJ2030220.1 hypothetical protein H4S03_007131 [Coemansia sp. S3946]KAJ2048643.1 hypothetical protein H4S04_003702 [Coemansia sp. S16]